MNADGDAEHAPVEIELRSVWLKQHHGVAPWINRGGMKDAIAPIFLAIFAVRNQVGNGICFSVRIMTGEEKNDGLGQAARPVPRDAALGLLRSRRRRPPERPRTTGPGRMGR